MRKSALDASIEALEVETNHNYGYGYVVTWPHLYQLVRDGGEWCVSGLMSRNRLTKWVLGYTAGIHDGRCFLLHALEKGGHNVDTRQGTRSGTRAPTPE
jgi:hypothetical protein